MELNKATAFLACHWGDECSARDRAQHGLVATPGRGSEHVLRLAPQARGDDVGDVLAVAMLRR
jgi:hypothetical protein